MTDDKRHYKELKRHRRTADNGYVYLAKHARQYHKRTLRLRQVDKSHDRTEHESEHGGAERHFDGHKETARKDTHELSAREYLYEIFY